MLDCINIESAWFILRQKLQNVHSCALMLIVLNHNVIHSCIVMSLLSYVVLMSLVVLQVSVDYCCHGPTGLSPLMCACMNGDTETVKLLLKHRADLTLCDQHQQSPLHYATWGGSLKAIKLILAHNSSVLSLRDDWGRTAFMVAAAKVL